MAVENEDDLQLKDLLVKEFHLEAAPPYLKLISVRTPTEQTKPQDGSVTYNQALTLTRFGKFNILLIFVSGMVVCNVLLETTAIGFILPVAQCDLHLTNANKGVLSAMGLAGIIVSSHFWGFLTDTKGRRKVIRPTLLAAFIMTLFSSFSTKFWMMVVLRFMNGVFVSGGCGSVFAYLGEFHTDKTRSRAMMGNAFIFSLGGMIAPIIAFGIINQDWIWPLEFLGMDFKPWRLFAIVCGIPGFLCGLSLFFLPESPKFLLSIGREEKAIEVLQKIHRWNGGKEDLKISHIIADEEDTETAIQLQNKSTNNTNFIAAFLETMWNQTVPLFQKKHIRSTVIVCSIQFWLFFPTVGMYIWFPHIINSMAEFMKTNPGEHKHVCQILYSKHESLYKSDGSMECMTKLEDTTYFYSLIMESLYAVFFALIGLLMNRVGTITILFICTIFFTAFGFATLFVDDPSIAAYLFMLFFLVGAGINVLVAVTVDLYPSRLRGMGVCISMLVGRLGGVAGANVVGLLLGTHCEITFLIACVPLIACAFLMLLIPKKISSEPTNA